MKLIFQILLVLLITIFLTLLTQIGGVAFLLGLLTDRMWKVRFFGKKLFMFLFFYAISTFILTPLIAPFFGREQVSNTNRIKPANFATIILNRNYVKPKLNQLLAEVDLNLLKINPDVQIRYLDANFPFFDGFPLLPHLSHNDGKKLDLSLVYENKEGKITTNQKSFSGYGAFSTPLKGEYDQVSICKNKGFYQYDFPKYLTFGKLNSDLKFSKKGTKPLITSILSSSAVEKIFLEPHLKNRLGLNDPRMRYQGCHSVRHDDHIHIQIK